MFVSLLILRICREFGDRKCSYAFLASNWITHLLLRDSMHHVTTNERTQAKRSGEKSALFPADPTSQPTRAKESLDDTLPKTATANPGRSNYPHSTAIGPLRPARLSAALALHVAPHPCRKITGAIREIADHAGMLGSA